MVRISLAIDHPTTDLWSAAQRRSMITASSNLVSLKWEYRIAEGGLWTASAALRLPPGSYARKRLVEQGRHGLAWIYWDRDSAEAVPDEETDLLWFGIAEDAKRGRGGSDVIEIALRGAGEFLKNTLYTGKHEGESIHAIADAIFDAAIADTGNPITAKDTDDSGILKRLVSIEFKHTPADRALKKLAELAGGPARVAWGVRPSDDGDDFGIGYMKLYAGHLYEKDTGVDRQVFTVDRSQILEYSTEAKSSGIENHIQVIGDATKTDPLDPNKQFHSGEAYSQDSIDQHGLRKSVVYDSSLETDGQCALVAAGICRDMASRQIDAEVEFVDHMRGNLIDTVGGVKKYFGMVPTTAKYPARLLIVRDQARDYRAWGDSQDVYRAIRNASTPRYSTIDTDNAPTGANLPIQDPVTLTSGDKRLYVFKRAQTGTTYTTSGLYIMEIKNRVGLLYAPSGGNWLLVIAYRNAAGTWGTFAASTATRSTAQISAEHTVALEVKYDSATNMRLAAYWGDGTTVTQMVNGTLAYTSMYSTGTPTRILVNGLVSSSGSPSPAGDCASSDTSLVEIWKSWDDTATATFLATHDNETPPFKRWGDLVLLASPSLRNVAGNAWVRYAFGTATLAGEYTWTPQAAGSESLFTPGTAFTRRNYSWMLGSGSHEAALGTHLEIVPERMTCEWHGIDAPLLIKARGSGGSKRASEIMEDLSGLIGDALENASKGIA